MVAGSVGASHRSEGSAPSFPAFLWEILDTEDFQTEYDQGQQKVSRGNEAGRQNCQEGKGCRGHGSWGNLQRQYSVPGWYSYQGTVAKSGKSLAGFSAFDKPGWPHALLRWDVLVDLDPLLQETAGRGLWASVSMIGQQKAARSFLLAAPSPADEKGVPEITQGLLGGVGSKSVHLWADCVMLQLAGSLISLPIPNSAAVPSELHSGGLFKSVRNLLVVFHCSVPRANPAVLVLQLSPGLTEVTSLPAVMSGKFKGNGSALSGQQNILGTPSLRAAATLPSVIP